VLSIAYVSAAVDAVTEADIAAILTQARANNQRDGLTGALLYHGGRFIQIIEGPDEVLLSRYATIAADPRHHVIQVVRQQRVAERQFAEWTMGFRPMSDDSVRQLDGFEDILGRTGRSRLEHADNEAQQFLEWLGEYWLPRG
jgi:hypothetical protein